MYGIGFLLILGCSVCLLGLAGASDSRPTPSPTTNFLVISPAPTQRPTSTSADNADFDELFVGITVAASILMTILVRLFMSSRARRASSQAAYRTSAISEMATLVLPSDDNIDFANIDTSIDVELEVRVLPSDAELPTTQSVYSTSLSHVEVVVVVDAKVVEGS